MKPEPVFVNVYGAQESIPRNRFRQPIAACRAGTTNGDVVPACQAGNRFLGSLRGIQIRALASRYDNPIPTRFLAPIDSLKIPAQVKHLGFANH
jgi:hypothetical protein